ncbi:hypothetical protein FOZ60_013452 [Perkinsus olseni]|uniref:Uncharacterized protein n=1 Tax=Perkinsus olseni TaxID=32597 RepID=A0A7J6N9A2_PEROL|nr:hypothetical protein FOZ60_013452 [Perkinsus olseni]
MPDCYCDCAQQFFRREAKMITIKTEIGSELERCPCRQNDVRFVECSSRCCQKCRSKFYLYQIYDAATCILRACMTSDPVTTGLCYMLIRDFQLLYREDRRYWDMFKDELFRFQFEWANFLNDTEIMCPSLSDDCVRKFFKLTRLRQFFDMSYKRGDNLVFEVGT